SPSILEHLAEKISRRFPEAKVVGMISPPYRPFTKVENRAFIAEMNQSKADIIWVGLGAPRQERWMYENYSKLDRGVMIGIGAGFDYLAGNIKHAPEWMKRWALEWLYRLIQEPRRLWKRYLVTNSLFLLFLFLEMLHLKKFE
ncbi:MAG: glycosyltransferase, partial [Calditrichaeota bacterium]